MSYALGRRRVDAMCYTCGKRWQTPNAQAVAAIHARKYNHYVGVETVQYIFYGDKSQDKGARA